MGKSEAQKQKKLAKKRSRELAKQKEAAREKNRMISFAGQWASALTGSFGKIWIGRDIHTEGIGQVFVTRNLPDRRVAIVRFLVDSYCLGVKNVDVEFDYPSRAVDMIEFFESRDQVYRSDVTPADAAKVIHGAVEYARELGIEPHASYGRVADLFDDVDITQATYEIKFGKDGKPLFMPGPYDSPEQIMEIVDRAKAAGKELEIDYAAVNEFDALNDPELDVDIDEDVDPSVIDALESSVSKSDDF